MRDLSRREFFVLLPLVFLTILLGIAPNIILDTLHFSVSSLIIDTTNSILSSHINPPPAPCVLLAFLPSFILLKHDDSSTSGEEPSYTLIYDNILDSRS